MYYDYTNVIEAGEKLVKMLKDIMCRTHVKSKTSLFKNKISVSDAVESSNADSFGELLMGCAFATGFSVIGAPFRHNNKITDKREEQVRNECRNYIELLQNLPLQHSENIKVQKIMCYLQDDYSSVTYKEKFFKDLLLDSEDEKKIILFSQMVEDIIWNSNI